MENYKIKGKKVTMPSGWHDIPYKIGYKILSENLDVIQTASLLTGLSEEEVKRSEDVIIWMSAFTFLQNPPDRFNEFPRSVKLGVDRLVFPFVSYADEFDLGQAEVGQIEDMRALYAEREKEIKGEEERDLTDIEFISTMPVMCAIYLQKILDGAYDGEKALRLEDRVKEELSMKEVVSMGAFFLSRLSNLIYGSTTKLSQRNTMKRKLVLGLKNLMQRLVS